MTLSHIADESNNIIIVCLFIFLFFDVYFTQFGIKSRITSYKQRQTINKSHITVRKRDERGTQQGTEKDDGENWFHVHDTVFPM